VVEYLTTDDVTDLHVHALHATGDVAQGLRNRGLLESAVMRPQFLAHYSDADLFEQAAALACGISRSRAFVDGNKRVAQTSAAFFLAINGLEVAEPLAMARVLLEAAQPGTNQDDAERALADWLRLHTCPMSEAQRTPDDGGRNSTVRSPPDP
jgi:death-on-curing protein